MSDELLKKLQEDNLRLSQELSTVKAEAMKYRKGRRAVKVELEKAQKGLREAVEERDGLKTRLDSDPGEWAAEVDRLKGEIRTRDHKDVFRKVAGDLQVRPEALEDLWSLSGYKAESDVVDLEAMRGRVAEAVKARPYLLREAEAPADPVKAPAKELAKEKLIPGPGFSRGAGGQVTGGFTITKSQIQDPEFVRQNQARISEAQKSGNFAIIPG